MSDRRNQVNWKARGIYDLATFAAEGLDKVEIARLFSCTPDAIRQQAYRHGIVLPPLKPQHRKLVSRLNLSPDQQLRKRWDALIGPMKKALHNELISAGVVE